MKCLLALAATLLAACNGSSPSHFCALSSAPGVVVKLTDAQTGEPIQDATIVLSNREHSETLVQTRRDPDAIYAGMNKVTGTFELVVTADAYKRMSQEGIEVQRDGCHMRTQNLSVELDPEPGTQDPDIQDTEFLIIFRTETDAPTEPGWIAVPVPTK